MKKINIGLIGFGNVGASLVKLLKEKRSVIQDKIGVEFNFKKICDKDTRSRRLIKVDRSLLTKRINDILDDPEINVVVELIGGLHPAKEIVAQALKKKKHVVTANKAILAESIPEIFKIAKRYKRNIYFEASVAAGIPIIKTLREGLIANRFNAIFGIINGTSNYILSQMAQENCTFNAALQEAKKKGYAERKPALDIEGVDSAHKLIILTYLAFGKFVKIKDVFIEGIKQISLADIKYADELGLKIKLLAIAKKIGNELEIRVHPTLIPKKHLLASVNGIFNAIYIDTDLAGDLLLYGQGAGGHSAASAVASDLVDLAKIITSGNDSKSQFYPSKTNIKKLRRISQIETRYYIRFMAIDKPGVLAKISGILSKYGISIASVTQKERRKASIVPIVMLIHEAKEKNIRFALEKIAHLGVIKQKPVAIRIEEV